MSRIASPRGTLHLLPVPIVDGTALAILPARTCAAAQTLRHFVVENARSARRALKDMGHPGPLQDLDIIELPGGKGSQAVPATELAHWLAPLARGVSIGVMSESGCPGIADPGAALAAWAHAHGYPVLAHVGPSSLLLALMGSGLDGQRFSFHGYLPVEAGARADTLRALERRSARERASQLFIETPYRNGALCAALLATLDPATRLTIATDLTGGDESLRTRTIGAWRAAPPDLARLPTVFAFQAVPAPTQPTDRTARTGAAPARTSKPDKAGHPATPAAPGGASAPAKSGRAARVSAGRPKRG